MYRFDKVVSYNKKNNNNNKKKCNGYLLKPKFSDRIYLIIQMSAGAKQVKPLGNLTCIEVGSREYFLVILDSHSVEERNRIR